MVRAGGVAMSGVGLVARAALGFVGLSVLIAWAAPAPGPPGTSAVTSGDPTRGGTTVALRIPDGALATHLRVIDAAGRELAGLTYWVSGETTVVSGRRDGAGVTYHLNDDGSASLLVAGTAREIRVDAGRDGSSRVTDRPSAPAPVLDMSASDETQYPSGSEAPGRFRQGMATRIVDPHGG